MMKTKKHKYNGEWGDDDRSHTKSMKVFDRIKRDKTKHRRAYYDQALNPDSDEQQIDYVMKIHNIRAI